MPRLIAAMQNAEEILQSVQTKKSNGYIIQKKELKAVINPGEPQEELLTYQEFHPMLFRYISPSNVLKCFKFVNEYLGYVAVNVISISSTVKLSLRNHPQEGITSVFFIGICLFPLIRKQDTTKGKTFGGPGPLA